MNGYLNTFTYRLISVQHLLNKALTKRKNNNRSVLSSQLLFWIVEILLRVYNANYQCGYIHIHHFNEKRMILQGFKLSPCDGKETTDPFYRLIPALPIVVELAGGIGQSVVCRCQFPALLQYLSYLVFLGFYL